jgi:protein SCO1/2
MIVTSHSLRRALASPIALVLLLGSSAIAQDQRLAAPVAIGGPFALTAGDGQPVTDKTYRGRWLLIYFGYTHCPNICPTVLSEIAATLDKLGPLAAKIQPLYISIDPARDTQRVMEEYVRQFDPRIVGLTGSAAEIAQAAAAYHVFYRREANGTNDDYFMEHSAFVYVMDPTGRYVTLFAPAEEEGPDYYASRLRALLTAPRANDTANHSGSGS